MLKEDSRALDAAVFFHISSTHPRLLVLEDLRYTRFMKTSTSLSRITDSRLFGAFGLCFLVVLAASVVLSKGTNTNDELPNFHEVNHQLYRGAQPGKDGFKRLAQLGIRTIVNLRVGGAQAHAEETEAHAAGLRYFHAPLREWSRPTDEQVDQVLGLLNNSENQPVFVHCRLGADRTGLVVAIYRITHDGWTNEQARAEAKQYGMHPWELAMKDYLRHYHKRPN